MRKELRWILAVHGKLSTPLESLDDEADLFAAGMDSLAVVNIMLAIEERFKVELPDTMLNRRSFASIAALERAVSQVTAA